MSPVGQHGHSADDYLQVIHYLVSPVGELGVAERPAAIATRVADILDVTRASAGEALNRLESDGLIERDEARTIVLTETGAERARHAVRRRRVAERFLTDFLGYPPADIHADAEALSSALSDDMVDRLHARLGEPHSCPHGWPIEPQEDPDVSLVSLSDLRVGDGATIMRLLESDHALLRWFYDEGFVPGAELRVIDIQPAAGHLRVDLQGAGAAREQFIAEQAARGLLVRRRESTP